MDFLRLMMMLMRYTSAQMCELNSFKHYTKTKPSQKCETIGNISKCAMTNLTIVGYILYSSQKCKNRSRKLINTLKIPSLSSSLINILNLSYEARVFDTFMCEK